MCGANPCNRPNCSWSSSFLKACEARWVMQMPREKRGEFYELVRKMRGEQALSDLKERVKNEWKNNQKNNQQPSLL